MRHSTCINSGSDGFVATSMRWQDHPVALFLWKGTDMSSLKLRLPCCQVHRLAYLFVNATGAGCGCGPVFSSLRIRFSSVDASSLRRRSEFLQQNRCVILESYSDCRSVSNVTRDTFCRLPCRAGRVIRFPAAVGTVGHNKFTVQNWINQKSMMCTFKIGNINL